MPTTVLDIRAALGQLNQLNRERNRLLSEMRRLEARIFEVHDPISVAVDNLVLDQEYEVLGIPTEIGEVGDGDVLLEGQEGLAARNQVLQHIRGAGNRVRAVFQGNWPTHPHAETVILMFSGATVGPYIVDRMKYDTKNAVVQVVDQTEAEAGLAEYDAKYSLPADIAGEVRSMAGMRPLHPTHGGRSRGRSKRSKRSKRSRGRKSKGRWEWSNPF